MGGRTEKLCLLPFRPEVRSGHMEAYLERPVRQRPRRLEIPPAFCYFQHERLRDSGLTGGLFCFIVTPGN